MPYEEILYSTKGPRGYLTLNDPDKINALSKIMIGEIIHALNNISEDESIKVRLFVVPVNIFVPDIIWRK